MRPPPSLIASFPGCNSRGGYRRANRLSCRFVPRRRESSERTFHIRSFVVYWIPACAGMTNKEMVVL